MLITWTIFGHYLDTIWTIFQQILNNTLDILDNIWTIFGQFLMIFGQYFNNNNTVYQPFFNDVKKYLNMIWSIFGKYFDNIHTNPVNILDIFCQ